MDRLGGAAPRLRENDRHRQRAGSRYRPRSQFAPFAAITRSLWSMKGTASAIPFTNGSYPIQRIGRTTSSITAVSITPSARAVHSAAAHTFAIEPSA